MTSVNYIIKNGLAVLVAGLFFTQCSSDSQSDDVKNDVQKTQVSESNSGEHSNIMSFDGQLFSVPSPIQTASLIKKSGVDFKSDLTNSSDNLNNYTTTFKQALNLGVYGADFAYISYYGQDQLSLSYMKSIRSLVESLDLSSSIDSKLVDRIVQNVDNKDSLISVSSAMFRSIDNYLKNNERTDVAALILTGGFIESLYFSANLAKEDLTGKLSKRIGEEKQTVILLMQLLAKSNDPNFESLVSEFTGLVSAFSAVETTYEYVRPETDPVNKTTKIKSKSSVTISEETLDRILIETKAIRTFITE